MAQSRRHHRSVLAVLAVLALIGSGAAPAFADPPTDWTLAGSPVVTADYTAGWEVAEGVDPFGVGASSPVPLLRPVVTNTSGHDLRIGYGMDLFSAGTIDPLWKSTVWEQFGFSADDTVADSFAETLEPGQSTHGPSADGLPQYAGRTVATYLLDDGGTPADPSDDTAAIIAQFSAPGRFVPVHLGGDDTLDYGWDAHFGIGRPATVAGPGQELFPGVQATVTATGLTPGESLEMWLVPGFDYFYLLWTGGALPAAALQVGTATVAGDGSVSATFTIPADASLRDDYQLSLGVSAERYWPAGSYRNFRVQLPTTSASTTTPSGSSTQSLDLGATDIGLTFPAGTTGGTTTAVATATGPVAGGFQFASDPPLFYHLSSTAAFTGTVRVCVSYDPAQFPGSVPFLYHYETIGADHRWVNITASRTPGAVCGDTTGFSPFVLGRPADDGSRSRPAVGVLSDDNGWDTGLKDGSYAVTMNLWWGENASLVRLYENGSLVREQSLTRSTPQAQQAVFAITGRVNGTYVYTAELENSRGITTTKPLKVIVTQASPGKPALSTSGTVRPGQAFTLRADLWWGTNATNWRMLRGDAVIASGSFVAATPGAQSVSLPVTLPAGTYAFTVEFSNAAGTTASAPLTVRVK